MRENGEEYELKSINGDGTVVRNGLDYRSIKRDIKKAYVKNPQLKNKFMYYTRGTVMDDDMKGKLAVYAKKHGLKELRIFDDENEYILHP